MGNRTCSIRHNEVMPFSQSTCRSLRLISFQEKQEQGYTFSIHNIFTCSKVKGVKMPRPAKEKAEIEFSVPETFRICELYQEEHVLWDQGSPEYFKRDKRAVALERMKENSTSSYYYTCRNSNIIFLHFLFSGVKAGKEITHDFVMPV